MKIGTRSLLFGVHQFVLHPLAVLEAWYRLYGTLPTWQEAFCILIHDWGYWGCKTMDGADGASHPALASRWVMEYFGDWRLSRLCLLHSRHYAAMMEEPVSKLYYADKLSFALTPRWLYCLLGRLSGEIKEYKELTWRGGQTPRYCSDKEWYFAIRKNMIALSKNPDAVSYLHGRRSNAKV